MPSKTETGEAEAPPLEDVPMQEAPAAGSYNVKDTANPTSIRDAEQRIRVLPGSSEYAASFEFKDEDHTLGNALRYIIMKNPDVEFCGYSIPHPSEPLMNVRIQTYAPHTAIEALDKGFNDLAELCAVVEDKFTAARDEFAASKMQS